MSIAIETVLCCVVLVAVITSLEGNVVDDIFGTQLPVTELTPSLSDGHGSGVFKPIIISHVFHFIFGKNAFSNDTQNGTSIPLYDTTTEVEVGSSKVPPTESTGSTTLVPSSTSSTPSSSPVEPTFDPDQDDDGTGIGAGWLAAVIMGGVAGGVAIIFLVIFVIQKLERRRSADEADPLLETDA